MDNTNDNTNKPGNELDIAAPNEIELVDDIPPSPLEESTPEEIDTPESVKEVDQDEQPESTERSGGLSRLELESLIQRYMDDVEKLKSQIKSEKEMYNASFENDAAYSQAEEASKETKKKVAEIKQKITQQPAVKDAEARMGELKDEMKDVQDAISGLAEQYQQVAGTNQIVQDDGQVLEIVRNFKVIRKKS